MNQETKKEFTFNYSKYKSKKVNLKMVDDLMETTIASGTSKFAAIVAGVKILLFFAYLWARKRLIEEEFLIQKQNYEQNQVNETDDILDNDDLDETVEEDNLD